MVIDWQFRVRSGWRAKEVVKDGQRDKRPTEEARRRDRQKQLERFREKDVKDGQRQSYIKA